MSYVRLRSELLATREAREAALADALRLAGESLVFASTAVPGAHKSPPGTAALLQWALELLRSIPGPLIVLGQGEDALGPYALLTLPCAPRRVKRACVALEDQTPQARLLDLDVYGRGGVRVGRSDLGLPARPCLLCQRPAVECMRLRRHDTAALASHAERLLSQLAAPPAG